MDTEDRKRYKAAWLREDRLKHPEKYAKDKEAAVERARKWRITNQEKHRAYTKQYNQEHEEWNRMYQKEWQRQYNATSRYGLTKAEFDALKPHLDNGMCMICEEEGPLEIDHDHATGKFRGLICSRCNKALGLFKDNSSTVESAGAYLLGKPLLSMKRFLKNGYWPKPVPSEIPDYLLQDEFDSHD